MTRGSKSSRLRSPTMVGASSLIGLLAAVEALIRAGLISRHVVPLPSQIVAALPRIIAEEDILGRFLMTAGEAAAAGLLLVAGGGPPRAPLPPAPPPFAGGGGWGGGVGGGPPGGLLPPFLAVLRRA